MCSSDLEPAPEFTPRIVTLARPPELGEVVGGGGGVVVGAVVVVGPTTVMVGGTPMVVAAAGEVVPEGELVAPFTTAASDEHDATPNVARINSTAAFLIAPPMWSTSRFYHGASRSPVW